MKTHLIRFDGSGLTLCGKNMAHVIAYGLDGFKEETGKYRCMKCVAYLAASHPSLRIA